MMKAKKWIKKSSTQLLLMLFVSIGIVACNKNDDGGGNTKASPIATSLGLISGDNQTAVVETMLTNDIVVLVKDQNGIAFSGAKVNFKVIEGTVSSTTITTGSDGKATISWELGTTVNIQILTITAFKADGTTALTGSPLLITASAIAVPLVATSLELISSSQNEELRIATDNVIINMLVKDQNGDPINEMPLNFSVVEGVVVASENSSTPITWTLGTTVGTQTLTVTAFKEDGTTHLVGSPFSVIVNTEALVASKLILISSEDIEGIVNNDASTKTITVKVLNNLENPFVDSTVDFSVEQDGGFLSALTALTNADGIATVDWTPSEVLGFKNITVSANNTNGTPLVNSPMVITTKTILAIGAFYKGGLVAYIDSTEEHGFVCSLADLGKATWGCYDEQLAGPNGMSDEIGEGAANSLIIIVKCATAGIAARLCTDLTLQGFSDWWLPSTKELERIDLNFTVLNEQLIKHRGESLSNEGYWSSNEVSAAPLYLAHFVSMGPVGNGVLDGKNNENNVRAIRYF